MARRDLYFGAAAVLMTGGAIAYATCAAERAAHDEHDPPVSGRAPDEPAADRHEDHE